MTSSPVSQINRPSRRRDTLRRAIGSRGGVAAVRGFLRATGRLMLGGYASDQRARYGAEGSKTLLSLRGVSGLRCSVVRLVHAEQQSMERDEGCSQNQTMRFTA